MVKHRKTMMILAILLLVALSVTSCSFSATTDTAKPSPTLLSTPTPTLAPTPTPIPMVRVTVRLTYVVCKTKQDALGFHDHFYMVTIFAANGSGSNVQPGAQSQLLPAIDMDSGQAVGISQNSQVFDGLVSPQGSIEGGFIGYNDTQGLAWGNIMVWVAALAKTVADKSVGGAIETGNGIITGAAGLLDLAANAWYATANMNNSDTTELGRQELSVSASGPPSEDGTVTFHNDGGWFGSGGWDYTVGYQITRTPV